MDAKTLRSLAKAAGLKPMVFFRLSPEQVLEAIKEHNPEVYKDVETWPNEVATAHIATLTKKEEAAAEKQEADESIESAEKPKEEAKPASTAKKKTTRKSSSKKESAKKSSVSLATDTNKATRTAPTKKRPKKKGGASGTITPKVAFSADIEEIKARMEMLEDQLVGARTMISELTSMNKEMMLFFTWWHNKYLSEDPEPEILGIDWETCISDQLNGL